MMIMMRKLYSDKRFLINYVHASYTVKVKISIIGKTSQVEFESMDSEQRQRHRSPNNLLRDKFPPNELEGQSSDR